MRKMAAALIYVSYADPDLPHLNFDIEADKAPVPIIN